MKMNSRHIPSEIRKYLRKEVGYGCPVSGCRNPFLEYHHFNPKYSDRKEHSKEGMIALCPNHHRKADRDRWTNDELIKLKKADLREIVNGTLDWNLKDSIIIVGNNYFFGDLFTFSVFGNELFGIAQTDNRELVINALIWDSNMKPVAQIVENDILINNLNIGDLNCSASGHSIRIESEADDTYYELYFKRVYLSEFEKATISKVDENVWKYIKSNIANKVKDGKVLTIVFTSRVKTDKILINIQDSNVKFDFTKLGFIKGSIGNNALQGGIGINFGKERFHFGCKEL
jgi:hypothetical protein